MASIIARSDNPEQSDTENTWTFVTAASATRVIGVVMMVLASTLSQLALALALAETSELTSELRLDSPELTSELALESPELTSELALDNPELTSELALDSALDAVPCAELASPVLAPALASTLAPPLTDAPELFAFTLAPAEAPVLTATCANAAVPNDSAATRAIAEIDFMMIYLSGHFCPRRVTSVELPRLREFC